MNYIYAGRLLEQTGSTNVTMFYHQDAIGNTLAMTNMTGAAIDTYSYDAFGASELISGTAINNRQFTGHVSDNTGLIYMNARYYDPGTGRFLTQDTVPGRPMDPLSYNQYAYCKNNPTAYVDPNGNWGACVHGNDTFQWAVEAGFDEWQAIIIVVGCLNVDSNPNTSPIIWDGEHWIPNTNDYNLSWHFDRSRYVDVDGENIDYGWFARTEDTRTTRMKGELEIFRDNANDVPIDALFSLGRAMHALQDIDAHGSLGYGSKELDGPHDLGLKTFLSGNDHTDDPEFNSEKYSMTKSVTLNYLISAHDNYNVGDVSYDEMTDFVNNDDRVTESDRWWVNVYAFGPKS